MTRRQVGVAGLLLVGLTILSFVVTSGGHFGAPEADRSDATILDWYTDSGNQARYLLAAMIGGIAVVAFLVFLVGLRRMLELAGASATLIELFYLGGVVVATLAYVQVAVGSGIAATFAFSDTFELDADTARIVLTIGNIWLPAISGIPSALFIGAACFAARRARFFPGWLTWTGFVLAVLSLLAFPGLGANSFALFIFVFLACIVLLRRPARP